MDPQACLLRLLEAIDDADRSETVESAADLLALLLAGRSLLKRPNAADQAKISYALAQCADALEEN